MPKELYLRKLAEETAREAAKETVKETFKLLGLDAGNVMKLSEDLYYLRKLRTGAEATKHILKSSAIKTFVVALVTVFLLGLKHWMKDHDL